MAIETEEVTRVIQRGNDLAVEATQALVDGAYIAPRQTLELGQAALRTVEANHQATRDLTEKLVRQTFETQALWWRFFQTTLRLSAETFTRAAEVGLAAGREEERIITAQTAAIEKRAAAAAK